MKPGFEVHFNILSYCHLVFEVDIPILLINRLMPNDPYMGRTAPLTSKRCILYI